MPLNANQAVLKNAKTFGGFTGLGLQLDPSTELVPPATPVPTTVGTGGTVLAGVYGVKVTYVSATGETTGSALGTVTTTGTTSTITVPSPGAVTGATGWYAYISQVNGATLTRQQTPGSPTAIGSGLTLTAPPTSTGAAPPFTNTSGVGAPGVPVAPTDFVLSKSNTLTPTIARVTENVQNNSSFSLAVDEPTIETFAGVLTYSATPTLGLLPFMGALGGTASPSGVTATSSGAATSTTQYTTIPITGAFVAGRPVVCGLGTNSEPSIIYSYSTGSLVVFKLQKNATASSGLSVTMPAEKTYANSLMAAGTVGQMPLITVEKNQGGDHSFQYPDVYVESLTATMGTGTCEIQAGLYGTSLYNTLTSSTSPAMATFNPSTNDYNAATRPWTAMNSLVAVYTDIDGNGMAVQAAVGIKSAKITYNLNLVKEQILGNSVMQAWPGSSVSCQIDWTEIDTARYNALYEQAVRTGTGTQMYLGYAKNTGTATSPNWRFIVFEIPYAKYTASVGNDPLNATADYANVATSMVQRGSTQDLLKVHIV